MFIEICLVQLFEVRWQRRSLCYKASCSIFFFKFHILKSLLSLLLLLVL